MRNAKDGVGCVSSLREIPTNTVYSGVVWTRDVGKFDKMRDSRRSA